MPSLVLDTHATIWYLEASPKLSATVLAAIAVALTAGDPVHVSTVTIVELTYLVEKGRFPVAILDRLLLELRRPKPELLTTPFDLDAAQTLGGRRLGPKEGIGVVIDIARPNALGV